MGAEGTIAIVAGVLAGSIALVGFGIDSAIEGFASAIIVWRFTGARIHSAAAELRAQKLVALQFFLSRPTSVSRPSCTWPAASGPRPAGSAWRWSRRA